jgi:Tfp pilus assembly protein PilO
MEQDLQTARRCTAIIIKKFDYEKKELSVNPLKELKTVVRRNEKIIPEYVDVLFGHLHKEDSDLRLGVVLLMDYFFQRSHRFRVEVVENLQDFLIYTIETDPLHYPLPKPPAAANALKLETLKLIRLWIDKFGAGYAKLKNAEHFLRTSKNFDFSISSAELQIERRRAEEERLKREVETRKVVEKVEKSFRERHDEIQQTLMETKTAFELVFPKFSGGHAAATSSSLTNEQLHGYDRKEGNISIVIPSKVVVIEESEDNRDLVAALKDLEKIIQRQHAKVTKWVNKLTKVGDSSSLLRRLINVKSDLSTELAKFRELNITKVPPTKAKDNGNSEDDDSDFEDVAEKEGLEMEVISPDDDDLPQHILDKIRDDSGLSDKPGPSGL